MSMQVILIQVDPALHQRIVESDGQVLNEMGGDDPVEGFDPEVDLYDELDYRDITPWADDSANPMHPVFTGDELVDGYEWNYGAPMFHDLEQCRAILARFRAHETEHWQIIAVRDFFARAVAAGKGVIVGIT